MKLLVTLLLITSALDAFPQTGDTFAIEGTILYLASDSLPQDVVVIKCRPDELSQKREAFWMYFQAMKWTQPDLNWELNSCRKQRVVVDGIENPFPTLMRPGGNECFMTYGKITLTSRPGQRETPVKEYSLVLHAGGGAYTIRYLSEPAPYGVPMSFECLDW